MPDVTTDLHEFLSTRSKELSQAIEDASLPGLGSGPSNQNVAAILEQQEKTGDWPDSLLAGLWLLAGDLDRSHSFSQQDASAEGSFWHGIMHRREGDFSNAAYWFRRVGHHPVLDGLAQEYPDHYATPGQFIDVVQSDRRSDQLKRIQWSEWQALMIWCGREGSR